MDLELSGSLLAWAVLTHMEIRELGQSLRSWRHLERTQCEGGAGWLSVCVWMSGGEGGRWEGGRDGGEGF